MPLTSPYRIEVWNPNTNLLLADISDLCTSRHFSVRRNRPEQIDLTLNLKSAQKRAADLATPFNQIFSSGYNDLRIARGNRYLVGGQIGYTRASLEGESSRLELRATGYLDLLKDRYLIPGDPLTYTAADISAAAWAFINVTQLKTNGSFGMTQGTLSTSRNITDTWQPYATSIKDILIALSERFNSIDFEFTLDRVFSTYYPGIGTDKTDLRFSYPGNITSLVLPSDATQIINVSINRGSGNGDTQVVETRNDTNSQLTYKRREHIDDYPSINVPATLDDKGDETLRLSASPTTIPDIVLDGTQEPYLGAYWIGDRIKLDVDAGSAFAVLDGQTWRINEIDVTVDENDHETIRLKVGYS